MIKKDPNRRTTIPVDRALHDYVGSRRRLDESYADTLRRLLNKGKGWL